MVCKIFRERILTRFLVFASFVVLTIFPEVPGDCQTQSTNPKSNITSGEMAANPELPPKGPDEFRFTVAWLSASGGYIYVPEKWGELRINLVNARDEPRDLICSTYFSDQPNLQFARRVWVPAKSTLRISHPVVIPRCDPNSGRNLNLQSLVVDATAGGDVLVKSNWGQLIHDTALLVTLTPRNTGVIGGRMGSEPDIPSEEVSELVIATRVSQSLPKNFATLSDTFLPADESELNALDHIVIVENRITEDLAALSALRHWLHAGGHLWVMLDCADAIVLEALLGDDFRGEVLDRVGLTSVRVDKAPSLSDPEGDVGDVIEYEEPVTLVRMVAPQFDVTHVVNGWPAAMTKPYGDGRILITTLGARGWMAPRVENVRRSADPRDTSRFVPTPQMDNIASEFFGLREPELLIPSSIETQVREYVGYTIPSWGLIVGTLIGFSAALVAVAMALLRTGRLESLGWIGSLMAIAVSLGLLSIGRSYRQGVPGTVATIQVADAMVGTDEVRTHGVVAVYHPEGSQASVKVTGGGRMMPDMTGLENSPRRMVTTDLGKWHWENLPQPPGLRTTEFTAAEYVVDRIEARGTFDANGIIGHYSGRLPPGSDALIATRNGRLGVALNDDGSFVARADDLFESDQYLGSRLISDEQDRRRRTMEKLLNNPKRKNYPDRPQIMFWSDRWEHGYQFSEPNQLKSQGATLVAIPLTIDRPSNGTEFVIPSPLLTYRNRRDPDGNPPSTMWNFGRKEWQERSIPGTTWLNVQVPAELLPVVANRARIAIKVAGPIGRIEVMGLKQGHVVKLGAVVDPVGAITIDVNDADVLSIDAEGGLMLGIAAGDPSRPELTQTISEISPEKGKTSGLLNKNLKVNYWKIESLTVQLWVKTTEPAEKG